MPSPVPAPTPANWGYTDVSSEESRASGSWEYRVWVYWSNREVTSKIVNIPRPESGADVDVNGRIWESIHSLIREGTTFRHPDADLPTDPSLPDSSGPAPYGPPEAPPPDPDDPVGADDTTRTDGPGTEDTTTWFRP
jgi:hypothetical protein